MTHLLKLYYIIKRLSELDNIRADIETGAVLLYSANKWHLLDIEEDKYSKIIVDYENKEIRIITSSNFVRLIGILAKDIARTFYNKYIFYLIPDKMPIGIVKGCGDLSGAVYMSEFDNYF